MNDDCNVGSDNVACSEQPGVEGGSLKVAAKCLSGGDDTGDALRAAQGVDGAGKPGWQRSSVCHDVGDRGWCGLGPPLFDACDDRGKS